MSTSKEMPKPRLHQVDRQQLILRPPDVVGQLDLSRYYEDIHAIEGVAGRESLDPRLMISLWLYSYSEGIGSGDIETVRISSCL